MSVELIHALAQLEKEKGIDKEILIEAIEAALASAYKKNYKSNETIRVDFDKDTGDIRVYAQKNVVEEVNDKDVEISLKDANEYENIFSVGDVVEIEVTPGRFGRIAAQTAKQVVMQRIREAERSIIYNEFYEKENDIVTGIVQRKDKNNVIVDLGKTEGIMPHGEQVRTETYKFGLRLKFYILEVKKTNKGPLILLSRTHPEIVKRLFEREVPEIKEGIVEIKSIAREAGSRTKIAVFSKDSNVDAVGACVGQKGTRVQAIVDELFGEKIDIIKWSLRAEEFISSSLSPSEVIRVDVDSEENIASVIVPDFQLSLAIGKEGQNARLAARLTGWKIDIKSETQWRKMLEEHLLNIDQDITPDEVKNIASKKLKTENPLDKLFMDIDNNEDENITEGNIEEEEENNINEDISDEDVIKEDDIDKNDIMEDEKEN